MAFNGRNLDSTQYQELTTIPIQYPAPNVSGTGTVTSVTSANANATVANSTTTPVVTIVSAPKLQTARNINGTAFDGTASITVTAAAGTLTGATLNSGITSSSLTSFGTSPNINTATATSVNKVGITAPATSATLTIADGKTLTASNSIAIAGTDGTTMTFPPVSASVGYLGIPVSSKAADYTAVLTDSGTLLYQTGASKTFTIPANASVAYPIGTCLSFGCSNASGVSIAITSDTMYLTSTGATGTRTLAQRGQATAVKVESTVWQISGGGLT